MTLRERFEAAMRSQDYMWSDEELQFDEKRNCYVHFHMHHAYRTFCDGYAAAMKECLAVISGSGSREYCYAEISRLAQQDEVK